MDEVIGQMPSIRPPVLISSLPEDTPGPSAAVGDQSESDGGQPPTTGRNRKSDRDDELLDLIRGDMRQQREAEERRAGRGWTDCFHFLKDQFQNEFCIKICIYLNIFVKLLYVLC
ncbi:unnamed protein product [Oreochromis niloticus]|nr:unnamed protein product [Mustela putorius furo]